MYCTWPARKKYFIVYSIMICLWWFPSPPRSYWLMRRAGWRKLYTQWGPVGCAQAVSRYSSICLNDFGPVKRNLFICDDATLRKYHSTYHIMRQSQTLQPWPFHLLRNVADKWLYDMNSLGWTMALWIAWTYISRPGGSEQLYINENMSIHHVYVIQGLKVASGGWGRAWKGEAYIWL